MWSQAGRENSNRVGLPAMTTLKETKQALRKALGEADIAKAPGQKEWSRKDRKASGKRIRVSLKNQLRKQVALVTAKSKPRDEDY